jgi:hypothetical protein
VLIAVISLTSPFGLFISKTAVLVLFCNKNVNIKFSVQKGFYYEIELAFDAILGHKSAHSFATGPVIAEPAKEKQNLY